MKLDRLPGTQTNSFTLYIDLGNARRRKISQSGSGSRTSPLHRISHGKREERTREAHPRTAGTSQREQQENGFPQTKSPGREKENCADAGGGNVILPREHP